MVEIYHDVVIGEDVEIEGDVKIMHGAVVRKGVKIRGAVEIPADAIVTRDMVSEFLDYARYSGTGEAVIVKEENT